MVEFPDFLDPAKAERCVDLATYQYMGLARLLSIDTANKPSDLTEREPSVVDDVFKQIQA